MKKNNMQKVYARRQVVAGFLVGGPVAFGTIYGLCVALAHVLA